MMARTHSYRFALVFTGALAAAVCGCGAKTGTVKGKATVDGKPAVGATVIFSSAENQSGIGIVHQDGTYEAPGVPVGSVKVAVMSSPMPDLGSMTRSRPAAKKEGSDREGLAALAAPSPAIPKRYTDADTSGLTLTVTGGSNKFDIVMTSP